MRHRLRLQAVVTSADTQATSFLKFSEIKGTGSKSFLLKGFFEVILIAPQTYLPDGPVELEFERH